MPGATIVIKGTTVGTITNFDGIYSFSGVPGQTLAFSYIGYTVQEKVVKAANTIDIQLAQSAERLEESETGG